MSLAKVMLSGTVTSDPEKRFTPNNNVTVTTFNLTVTPPQRAGATGPAANNNQPFTIRVTCWRQLADAVAEQIQKGEEVLVEGKLMLNSFQSQEGVQKKNFEIEAATIEKLPGASQPILVAAAAAGNGESRSSGAGTGGGARYATQPSGNMPAAPQAQPPESFQGFSSEELLTEDDIPF